MIAIDNIDVAIPYGSYGLKAVPHFDWVSHWNDRRDYSGEEGTDHAFTLA